MRTDYFEEEFLICSNCESVSVWAQEGGAEPAGPGRRPVDLSCLHTGQYRGQRLSLEIQNKEETKDLTRRNAVA